MIEILAPAGDYDTLKAAVCGGADAVYAGGERFGARAYAKNFNRDELLSAIDYVHIHGKKLYLTVNTLVKEREFPELYEYLLPFYRQGLDAVIVQDMGVMEYILEQFPDLAIHASTQMTITNVISAKYLETLGVKRIVPARELSLEEVRKICNGTGLEVECFVHGALCYCYSGQCLLSSMIGGRSGNRGQCAQPCRLSYVVGKGKEKDILSLKDLCAIQDLPDLIEGGIHSFKIEGRMKRPEYVAVAVGMYRKYADRYLTSGRDGFRVSDEDIRDLERVYQRRGYCNGYYYRHNGKEILSLERPKQENPSEYRQNVKIQEKINGKFMISSGKHVTLYLQYHDIHAEVSGPVAEPAARQPLTRERLERQLRKTGNTPFVFEYLDIQMEGEAFLPMQAVNELRRRGMEVLEEKVLQDFRRRKAERLSLAEQEETGSGREAYLAGHVELTASAETLEQLKVILAYPEISRIYVEDALWASPENREELRQVIRKQKCSGQSIYFAMARIYREEAESFYDRYFDGLAECFDGVLVRNLESFLYVREKSEGFPIVTDSSIYQWNQSARRFWKRLSPERMTAPVELNRWELRELEVQDMELIIYGYLPVMVSAGCVKKNTAACDRNTGFLSMADRQHKKNIVKNECLYCYNVIYNSAPLMLPDQYRELKELGCKAARLQFSTEDAKRTREVLDLYIPAYTKGKECAVPEGEFTRGHFKRGVK